MPGFLIDEDLPRSLARDLRDAGLDALDVRDAGLRGASDDDILRNAATAGRILVTGDKGFANLLGFPLGSHAGIVVARFPNEIRVADLNAAILSALRALTAEDAEGNLIVVEPGRVRLRRKT